MHRTRAQGTRYESEHDCSVRHAHGRCAHPYLGHAHGARYMKPIFASSVRT